VELIVQFNLLHRLRDGLKDECVSGLAGARRRRGYACFQIVFDANGGRRHASPLQRTAM